MVAVTSDPDLQTCREFEIDQCLPKPLSTPTIIKALKNFWARSQSSTKAESEVASEAATDSEAAGRGRGSGGGSEAAGEEGHTVPENCRIEPALPSQAAPTRRPASR